MKIDEIIEAIESNRVNITHHAREESKNDLLLLDEIFYSTRRGKIIEDYSIETRTNISVRLSAKSCSTWISQG